MWTHALITACIITLTVLIIWLTVRARRAQRPISRWVGVAGGTLLALILLIVSGATSRGWVMLYAPRGRALAQRLPGGAHACADRPWPAYREHGVCRLSFPQRGRTGKTPFGKQLDSTLMPYKFYGRSSDAELSAIHAYLVSLP
jgi:hypothetical protein